MRQYRVSGALGAIPGEKMKAVPHASPMLALGVAVSTWVSAAVGAYLAATLVWAAWRAYKVKDFTPRRIVSEWFGVIRSHMRFIGSLFARKAAPKLGPSRFLVGLPRSASQEVKDAARSLLGSNAEMVEGVDKSELDSMAAARGIVSIMLEPDITNSKLFLAISSELTSETRDRIRDIIISILGDLESVNAAEIFSRSVEIRARKDDFNQLKTLIDKRKQELASSPLYNSTSMYDVNGKSGEVVIATTDTIALSDPLFSQGIQDIKASMPEGSKVPLLYGDDLKTLDQAHAFAIAIGLNISDIQFINKYDNTGNRRNFEDLITEIRSALGNNVQAVNIGIRASVGEINGDIISGRLLEIKEETVNDVKTLLTMNSCQALYRILKLIPIGTAITEDMLPPGAIYDPTTKRILYMPPIVARDCGMEIDTYRRAVLLLSSAA
jgi:hypothetical protein